MKTPIKTPFIYKLLVIFAMMTIMAGTLTSVMTYINLGFTQSFFASWLQIFLIATIVLMPTGLILSTVLTQFFRKSLPNITEGKRNILLSLCMALIMESIMAFIATANTVGFANFSLFKTQWVSTLIGALPIALLLMLIISFTVKPKIEYFLKN